MVEDAIGLLILVIVAVFLIMFAGLGVLFSLDLLSAAVSWIGLGPVVGWTALGAMLGALFGVVQGMRLRGRSDDRRKVYFSAVVAAALLLAAGVTSPAGRVLFGW